MPVLSGVPPDDDVHGAVAQLGERCVRNAEVGSSILLRSTISFHLNLSFWSAKQAGGSCAKTAGGTIEMTTAHSGDLAETPRDFP